MGNIKDRDRFNNKLNQNIKNEKIKISNVLKETVLSKLFKFDENNRIHGFKDNFIKIKDFLGNYVFRDKTNEEITNIIENDIINIGNYHRYPDYYNSIIPSFNTGDIIQIVPLSTSPIDMYPIQKKFFGYIKNNYENLIIDKDVTNTIIKRKSTEFIYPIPFDLNLIEKINNGDYNLYLYYKILYLTNKSFQPIPSVSEDYINYKTNTGKTNGLYEGVNNLLIQNNKTIYGWNKTRLHKASTGQNQYKPIIVKLNENDDTSYYFSWLEDNNFYFGNGTDKCSFIDVKDYLSVLNSPYVFIEKIDSSSSPYTYDIKILQLKDINGNISCSNYTTKDLFSSNYSYPIINTGYKKIDNNKNLFSSYIKAGDGTNFTYTLDVYYFNSTSLKTTNIYFTDNIETTISNLIIDSEIDNEYFSFISVDNSDFTFYKYNFIDSSNSFIKKISVLPNGESFNPETDFISLLKVDFDNTNHTDDIYYFAIIKEGVFNIYKWENSSSGDGTITLLIKTNYGISYYPEDSKHSQYLIDYNKDTKELTLVYNTIGEENKGLTHLFVFDLSVLNNDFENILIHKITLSDFNLSNKSINFLKYVDYGLSSTKNYLFNRGYKLNLYTSEELGYYKFEQIETIDKIEYNTPSIYINNNLISEAQQLKITNNYLEKVENNEVVKLFNLDSNGNNIIRMVFQNFIKKDENNNSIATPHNYIILPYLILTKKDINIPNCENGIETEDVIYISGGT